MVRPLSSILTSTLHLNKDGAGIVLLKSNQTDMSLAFQQVVDGSTIRVSCKKTEELFEKMFNQFDCLATTIGCLFKIYIQGV